MGRMAIVEGQVNAELRPIIEFCTSNASSYSKKVMEALEHDPDWDVDVVEYGCLGHCGECYLEPFALVNGDYVSGTTPEELLEKIKAKLKEQEEDLEKDFPF